MLLLLLAACDGVVLFNDPPELKFLSPEAGSALRARAAVTLTLAASDDEDDLSHLSYSFTDGNDEAIPADLTIDDLARKVYLETASLPVGEITVAVKAIDSLGEVGGTSMAITVVENVGPTARFRHPLDGSAWLVGTDVPVEVYVDDPVSGDDPTILLEWSGAGYSAPGAPAQIDGSGKVSFSLSGLVADEWTIGLEVTDAWGATGVAATSFRVASGDDDGDGGLSTEFGGDDCDDGDDSVYQGAPETCDGVDNDCDGDADDNVGTLWYADADGDGWGDLWDVVIACTQPDGYVPTRGDCDDNASSVYPGGTEVCGNGADDDCNGTIDDDAEGVTTAYPDGDGDGWGDGEAVTLCALDGAHALAPGDCDDSNAGVNPGASEVCDATNIDEDCDELADDDDDGVTGESTFYYDGDRDLRGDPATTDLRCDATTGWVENADDCDDSDDAAWTGNAEVCEDGSDNDCDGADANCEIAGTVGLGAADYELEGEGMLAFSGASLSGLDDVGGDGLGELLVGAWGYTSTGVAYLVSGVSLASGSLGSFSPVTGEASGDSFGYALAGCPDLDGDGYAEALVTALDAAGGAGGIYGFEGDAAFSSASAADSVAYGTSTDDALGAAIACGGDLDGDGRGDVLAGAPGAKSALVYDADLLQVAIIEGSSPGMGLAVSLLADVNGDSLDDLVAADPQSDAAYLFYGGGLGDVAAADADVIFSGEYSGDDAGRAVAGLGDFDGDGTGDLAVGAPESDSPGTAAGAAYLVYGSASLASLDLGAADAVIRGEDAGDRAGYTLAGGGDVDGDGRPDMLVGAYYEGSGGTGAGAAYLLYGGVTPATSLSGANARFIGETGGDGASEGLALGADMDGDGTSEVIVGAPAADSGGGAASGSTYIILGGSY
ncbi:MAG: putative metal-binding motif-containing protein [Deltaproteobacteria bacterium]|nr:putative metal-binding motif-containing protein [Deltaproteobacteria bacterium]